MGAGVRRLLTAMLPRPRQALTAGVVCDGCFLNQLCLRVLGPAAMAQANPLIKFEFLGEMQFKGEHVALRSDTNQGVCRYLSPKPDAVWFLNLWTAHLVDMVSRWLGWRLSALAVRWHWTLTPLQHTLRVGLLVLAAMRVCVLATYGRYECAAPELLSHDVSSQPSAATARAYGARRCGGHPTAAQSWSMHTYVHVDASSV